MRASWRWPLAEMCGPHLECDTSKSQQLQLFCAGCPGASPAITASYRGSQLFLYHANAVEDFRSEVLAPWFVRYATSKGHALDEVSCEVAFGTEWTVLGAVGQNIILHATSHPHRTGLSWISRACRPSTLPLR